MGVDDLDVGVTRDSAYGGLWDGLAVDGLASSDDVAFEGSEFVDQQQVWSVAGGGPTFDVGLADFYERVRALG